MKRLLLFSVALLAGATAFAAKDNPMVGGQKMYSSKDIIDNAVNSADHTTLVAAVKAAGLVDTLEDRARSQYLLPPMRLSLSCPRGLWIIWSSRKTKKR